MQRIWVHWAGMAPGKVLDQRFEPIGSSHGGPMGDVVRARDRITNDIVAIRFGAPASGFDADLALRLSELSELEVPGLARVIAHGLADQDARYLVLAWVSGQTVAEYQRVRGLTVRRAVRISRTVARCLAVLHEAGLSHGAISAERIVVGEDDQITLLEPAARASSNAADIRAAGRLLAQMLGGSESVHDLRAPAELATLVEALLSATVTATVAERRLGELELEALDDVVAMRAGALPPPQGTDDVATGPASPAFAFEDTAAVRSAGTRTPALGVRLDVPESLTIKPTDRYELKQVIGQGGLGRVMLAYDRELDRLVAVKELLQQTPESVARFQREALVTARLQHPGIVPVHDAGRWPNGSPYYAMKLVEGRDLALRIRECSGLAARLALVPNLVAVCETMAYAHDRRVIHRDLKPSNVVIGEFGETMIVDWGLAKDLDAPTQPSTESVDPYRNASAELTRAGDILGTPAYMAPEQARGDAVDERTDVYALGAMLYHVLDGAPPRRESSDAATAAGTTRARSTTVALTTLIDAPPDLRAIVGKAMADDPDARYPSARELAHELRRFEAGQLVSARQYTLGELVRRWIRKHRTGIAFGAVAVVAALAFTTFAIVRIVAAERTATAERAVAITERERAETVGANAAAERDRLRVLQAAAVIDRDPTAALAWLDTDVALPPALHQRAMALATRATAMGVAFVRHQLRGRIVALAAAGDHVVGASTGGSVAVWDRGGAEISRVELGVPATALALGPDAGYAVATSDRKLRWWRTAGASPIEITTAGAVTTLAFVGADLVFGQPGGVLAWWNGAGSPITLVVDAGDITTMRSLDHDVLVGTARGVLLRAGRDAVRWRHVAHDGAITDLAIAPNEIVSGGVDRSLVRWTTDGAVIARTRIESGISHLDADDSEIAILGEQPSLVRWSKNGTTTHALSFAGAALCWRACGWRIASGGPELWLERDGDRAIYRGHADRVEAVVGVDATTIASGDRVGEVRFWRLPSPTRVVARDASASPARTANGWILGRASGDIVEVHADGSISTLGKLPGRVKLVAARGNVVAATSEERIVIWRDGSQVVDAPLTGTQRLWIDERAAFVSAFADDSSIFRTDTGERILTRGSVDEYLIVVGEHAFFVEHGDLWRLPLAPHATPIRVPLSFEPVLATIVPDGRLAVGSTTGAIAIIDEHGGQIASLALGAEVLSLASNDTSILAGGVDGTVYGWQPADGTRVTYTDGHERWVHGVDPVGSVMVTWSRSAAVVRVWNREQNTAVVSTARIVGAAADPKGSSVLVVDVDGAARIASVEQVEAIAPGGLATYVDRHLRGGRR